MRKFWGTCLAVLFLLTALPASASPETARGACTVRFELISAKALDEPLSRWLEELAALTEIRVETARWPNSALVEGELRMGDERAFTLRLAREDGLTRLAGSLPGATRLAGPASDWADPLIAAAASLPGQKNGCVIALSGEGLADALNLAALKLRAWASLARAQTCVACEACGQCEACMNCLISEAAALVIESVATRFSQGPDENALLVKIELAEPSGIQADLPGGDVPEAGDDANVVLARAALQRIGEALIRESG